jgi:hypothetical protein
VTWTVAATLVALSLAQEVARYNFENAWPRKTAVSALHVDSSAPGLLASGQYSLDLEVLQNRLVGRLRQGNLDYRNIPFSVDGCAGVQSPEWATRAAARGLPPAAGGADRRVELRVDAANAPNCTIVGVFTPGTGQQAELSLKARGSGPVPGGRPDPGGPDQFITALPDLTIRATRRVQGNPSRLEVQIYNLGPGPAAATQVKFFYHKNGKVTTSHSAVPALAPKASTWVVVGAGMPIPAADFVAVRVDDPNEVAETNEGNNSRTVKK